MDKYQVLKQYFGYEEFREGQEGLIDHRGGLGDAIACLYELIESTPKEDAQ